MARPTAWTFELQTAICNLIERGNTGEDAAGVCGIDSATYYRWMRQGRNGEEPFSQFCEAVNQAKRAARVDLVAIIRNAATSDPKHWKAAQAVLERSERALLNAQAARRNGAPTAAPANLPEPEFWARLKAEALEKLALCEEWERSRALPAPAVLEAELIEPPSRKTG